LASQARQLSDFAMDDGVSVENFKAKGDELLSALRDLVGSEDWSRPESERIL
jgi:hypothetical protein